ncbi:MAG: hypothetical protein BRD23_08990 [Halobacteriales archaeon SW_9_67_25]|nr:MAG: hypothetical protein BRD23_08990 [Halobacteriales archaeon SW_9_67_25]
MTGSTARCPAIDLENSDSNPYQAEPDLGLVGESLVELGLPPALASTILLALSTVAAAATLAIGLAMQDVIKNLVAGVFIYTDKPFRTGFQDDIDRATDIILEAARATEGILDEPEPSVKLVEINEASFGLQSRVWIRRGTGVVALGRLMGTGATFVPGSIP